VVEPLAISFSLNTFFSLHGVQLPRESLQPRRIFRDHENGSALNVSFLELECHSAEANTGAPKSLSRLYELVRASATTWRERTVMRTHEHENARIVVVLRGHFEERFARNVREGRPGVAIYRPQRERHSERFAAGGGAYVSLSIPPEWFAARDCAPFDDSRCIRGDRFARIGAALAVEIARDDRWSQFAIEGLTLELVAEVARNKEDRGAPRWLERVCEAIREEPGARGSLLSLARIAGVHPAHLARTFRAQLGTSVGAYARGQRLEAARRLIERSELSLAEIAAGTGFYDQAHLARCFKSLYGVTPTAHRAATRSGRPTTQHSS
jgi:AraC family transcriptional regulator